MTRIGLVTLMLMKSVSTRHTLLVVFVFPFILLLGNFLHIYILPNIVSAQFLADRHFLYGGVDVYQW